MFSNKWFFSMLLDILNLTQLPNLLCCNILDPAKFYASRVTIPIFFSQTFFARISMYDTQLQKKQRAKFLDMPKSGGKTLKAIIDISIGKGTAYFDDPSKLAITINHADTVYCNKGDDSYIMLFADQLFRWNIPGDASQAKSAAKDLFQNWLTDNKFKIKDKKLYCTEQDGKETLLTRHGTVMLWEDALKESGCQTKIDELIKLYGSDPSKQSDKDLAHKISVFKEGIQKTMSDILSRHKDRDPKNVENYLLEEYAVLLCLATKYRIDLFHYPSFEQDGFKVTKQCFLSGVDANLLRWSQISFTISKQKQKNFGKNKLSYTSSSTSSTSQLANRNIRQPIPLSSNVSIVTNYLAPLSSAITSFATIKQDEMLRTPSPAFSKTLTDVEIALIALQSRFLQLKMDSYLSGNKKTRIGLDVLGLFKRKIEQATNMLLNTGSCSPVPDRKGLPHPGEAVAIKNQ